jgi:hypothetical protein
MSLDLPHFLSNIDIIFCRRIFVVNVIIVNFDHKADDVIHEFNCSDTVAYLTTGRICRMSSKHTTILSLKPLSA